MINIALVHLPLVAFLASYVYWRKANELTGHFKLDSQQPQQSQQPTRKRRPFANDRGKYSQKQAMKDLEIHL